MNLEMVKTFMKEVGWGFLATSDGSSDSLKLPCNLFDQVFKIYELDHDIVITSRI